MASLDAKIVESVYSPHCHKTPIIITNALRHGNFYQNKLHKIYGNKFATKKFEEMEKYYEKLDVPMNTNIIAMASRRGMMKKYNEEDVNILFNTAYSAFSGALEEAKHSFSQNKIKDNENNESRLLEVVIHSGNWGCGAFGGNVEMHSLLQIIAAHEAKIDYFRYHSVGEVDSLQVQQACKTIDDIFGNRPQLTWKEFMTKLLKCEYRWRMPNGT